SSGPRSHGSPCASLSAKVRLPIPAGPTNKNVLASFPFASTQRNFSTTASWPRMDCQDVEDLRYVTADLRLSSSQCGGAGIGSCAEAATFNHLRRRHNVTRVKWPKFSVAGAGLVEPHPINDVRQELRILGPQRHAPFPVVQAQ